jgi:hypothetical protein
MTSTMNTATKPMNETQPNPHQKASSQLKKSTNTQNTASDINTGTHDPTPESPWEFELWWSTHGRPSELLQHQVKYLIDFYKINPLLGDLKIIYQQGQWFPHITMDGWMKMINQHPAFCGIDFRESDQLIEGVPEWVSCTIYRQDRVIPITIREYYVELKQESSLWNEIPRRMLRFRSMQQCARLALGLSTPEFTHPTHEIPKESLPPFTASTTQTQLEKIKGHLMQAKIEIH